jgi:uroporphyrinogen decarboxylase
MQSPKIFRELSLPTLEIITKMAKEAGIPSELHSCGKERLLVPICVEETDLDCINPLEPFPMGDCELGEIKRKFGKQISLMGNINTSLMFLSRSQEIEEIALKCLEDAMDEGGFILSTGDQCGRDTPDENIRAMINVAKTYGKYR